MAVRHRKLDHFRVIFGACALAALATLGASSASIGTSRTPAGTIGTPPTSPNIVGTSRGMTAASRGLREVNWDPPAMQDRPDHDVVVKHPALLEDMIAAGKRLFAARFNVLDGVGRPEATGDSKPTIRTTADAPMFTRLAGPDANSCAGCHNQPLQGGSGDFAVNVFVGAHFTDPPTISADPNITNERNTISIFGSGAIEMVAREMTEDLQTLLKAGLSRAHAARREVAVVLKTKGISFGRLTARPDGTYDASGIDGVDQDLIVKPFGSKGVAVSLREFTIFALNQHHGMQAEERFGWERTGLMDFDSDGVSREVTVGQVSALALYQAFLAAPRRITYADSARREKARRGQSMFNAIGCSRCHVPALPLRTRFFTEPNPYNRPGSAVPRDLAGRIFLPLRFAPGTGYYYDVKGQRIVAAYTDLKRHKICDSQDMHFCNERRPQDFVPTDQFLTSKLWDVGSSAPYGHRGDLTTVSEAILHHSGEAKQEKIAFLSLSDSDKRAIILFLLSLRVE